jgi:hypothetical protein
VPGRARRHRRPAGAERAPEAAGHAQAAPATGGEAVQASRREQPAPEAHPRIWVRGLALRFFAFSIPLFLAWEYILRQPYLRLLGESFAASARLVGRDVHVVDVRTGEIRLSYGGIVWGDHFGLTGINVVALAALVLATPFPSWRRRLRLLVFALAALFVTQVLGLWTDIVHVHLHDNATWVDFADGLRAFMTGFGTFLFPLLIWVVLVRDRLPLANGRRP